MLLFHHNKPKLKVLIKLSDHILQAWNILREKGNFLEYELVR